MRQQMNQQVLAGYIMVQQAVWAAQKRLRKAQSGQAGIEYALVVAGVTLLIVVAIKLLSPHVQATYHHISTCLDTANTPVPVTDTATVTPDC